MEIVPNPSETYALDTPPGSTIAETATEHSSEPVSPPRRFGDISGILADSAFAQALADEARPLVNATAQGIQAMSDAPSALRQAIDPLVPRVATLENENKYTKANMDHIAAQLSQKIDELEKQSLSIISLKERLDKLEASSSSAGAPSAHAGRLPQTGAFSSYLPAYSGSSVPPRCLYCCRPTSR